MDVPVEASIEFPPVIEPPTELSVLSLQVVDNPGNAKVEDPPPPPPKIDISLRDAQDAEGEKNTRSRVELC